jgi:DNA-binding PadR family transcriptional regulator
MPRDSIGELEELVLLVVAMLGNTAYGISVRDALHDHAGRRLNISAVHAALHRLQDKGYLTSAMGGATPERGGRRKRLFRLTAAGHAVLADRRQLRNRLWNLGLAGGSA